MKKWRPSATARRAFAENMKNEDFANDYHKRREVKAEKRRSVSKFDYTSAGGNYVPTKVQADEAFKFLTSNFSFLMMTPEEHEACNAVFSSYGLNEKCDHDSIHIVNELIRKL